MNFFRIQKICCDSASSECDEWQGLKLLHTTPFGTRNLVPQRTVEENLSFKVNDGALFEHFF